MAISFARGDQLRSSTACCESPLKCCLDQLIGEAEKVHAVLAA